MKIILKKNKTYLGLKRSEMTADGVVLCEWGNYVFHQNAIRHISMQINATGVLESDATLLSVQVSPSMELLGFVFAGSVQKDRCHQEDDETHLNPCEQLLNTTLNVTALGSVKNGRFLIFFL